MVESAQELLQFVAGHGAGSELLFVDDGSADDTAKAVATILSGPGAQHARLLQCAHRGKGAAVRAGLAEASCEVAAFCDVDLSTPLKDLELVIRAAAMSRVLAIGSRDAATSRLIRPQGKVREAMGKAFNRVVQLSLAPGIADTQCGAKAASSEVWKAVLPWCEEEGFAWDVEAVAVARRLGIVVREIAIEWEHDDRSRVRVGPDGYQMLRSLPKILRRLRAVPSGTHSVHGHSGVFDAQQAATLLESDDQHWWFRCKGLLVSTAIRRHLSPSRASTRLVDVGGGAGGVTSTLGWPSERLVSVDGAFALSRQARDRHALLAAVSLVESVPFKGGSIGVVTLLDVLEHLQEPVLALREANRLLAADGLLVVNVPAHQWLWSGADELLGHVCRYTRPALRRDLEQGGFEVLWMSHVFSWLVGPVWLARRLESDSSRQLGLHTSSTLLSALAMSLTRVERLVLRYVRLPIGTSILAVAVPRTMSSA